MGKSRKDYEKFLNSISPDRDDEAWIIGGKNRYCGRENYGTMIKRYDPIGFNVGYREWVDEDRQEMDTKHLDCLAPMRKLELQEYLSQDVLAIEHSEYYKQLIGEDEWCEEEI